MDRDAGSSASYAHATSQLISPPSSNESSFELSATADMDTFRDYAHSLSLDTPVLLVVDSRLPAAAVKVEPIT